MSDTVCGSGNGCCGRHVLLWRYRVREISTDVLVASTKLVLRLTNAKADATRSDARD
jgi:hypothetical protein